VRFAKRIEGGAGDFFAATIAEVNGSEARAAVREGVDARIGEVDPEAPVQPPVIVYHNLREFEAPREGREGKVCAHLTLAYYPDGDEVDATVCQGFEGLVLDLDILFAVTYHDGSCSPVR